MQVDLGELDHEVIGNYFADDEFVLAVDEKEGVTQRPYIIRGSAKSSGRYRCPESID